MAKISDSTNYTVDRLLALWSEDWRIVAKLGQSLHPLDFDQLYRSSKYPFSNWVMAKDGIEAKVFLALQDVFDLLFDDALGRHLMIPEGCPDAVELLNLAAANTKRSYAPADLEDAPEGAESQYLLERQRCRQKGKAIRKPSKGTLYFSVGVLPHGEQLGKWSSDRPRFAKALSKIVSAMATSDTFAEAFPKIASEKDWEKFRRLWSRDYMVPGVMIALEGHQTQNHRAGKALCTSQIPTALRDIAALLLQCLGGERPFDETWWRCLWACMPSSIEALKTIENHIKEDAPLVGSEFERLSYYLTLGRPEAVELPDKNKIGYGVILRPCESDEMRSPFLRMMATILMQPAFAISQLLQEKCGKLRYRRQCRAPSCGKLFWTGKARAKACPGSCGDKKNPCALEWTAYSRYLVKIQKNPEKDWCNPALQKRFLSQRQSET